MEQLSEDRLSLLCPKLQDLVRQGAGKLEQENILIRITQGLRTFPEQESLYQIGRTTPNPAGCKHGKVGTCSIHPFGATVTNARGGFSWHNFGLAIDFCPDADPETPGFQPDWNSGDHNYQRVIEVMEGIGLVSGKSWHDLPHLELTGKFGPTPPDAVRALFKDKGISAVWDAALGN